MTIYEPLSFSSPQCSSGTAAAQEERGAGLQVAQPSAPAASPRAGHRHDASTPITRGVAASTPITRGVASCQASRLPSRKPRCLAKNRLPSQMFNECWTRMLKLAGDPTSRRRVASDQPGLRRVDSCPKHTTGETGHCTREDVLQHRPLPPAPPSRAFTRHTAGAAAGPCASGEGGKPQATPRPHTSAPAPARRLPALPHAAAVCARPPPPPPPGLPLAGPRAGASGAEGPSVEGPRCG
jgi:hypothetical protein